MIGLDLYRLAIGRIDLQEARTHKRLGTTALNDVCIKTNNFLSTRYPLGTTVTSGLTQEFIILR